MRRTGFIEHGILSKTVFFISKTGFYLNPVLDKTGFRPVLKR